MKLIFKVKYTEAEKKLGYNDIVVIVPNISTDESHTRLTQHYYGLLTAMGYILGMEHYEVINE